ncbi:hypothetical protein DEU56DRAFT_272281 [Suillus clintonianus]|uniref:uncharacterized protein n=1 Tax=Suillus clintonianus TaxID=1904413 RepID=UPI001B8740DC|nr:uncharacterized protein DEU56DRAFT_272281 [Suillus clintonianus]KAG2141976.1 hypothetical protein DEU56DRAFT_272281 [Suillus clintonianus]
MKPKSDTAFHEHKIQVDMFELRTYIEIRPLKPEFEVRRSPWSFELVYSLMQNRIFFAFSLAGTLTGLAWLGKLAGAFLLVFDINIVRRNVREVDVRKSTSDIFEDTCRCVNPIGLSNDFADNINAMAGGDTSLFGHTIRPRQEGVGLVWLAEKF